MTGYITSKECEEMWQATAQPLFQYYIYLDTRQELKINRWHRATQQHSCVAWCHLYIHYYFKKHKKISAFTKNKVFFLIHHRKKGGVSCCLTILHQVKLIPYRHFPGKTETVNEGCLTYRVVLYSDKYGGPASACTDWGKPWKSWSGMLAASKSWIWSRSAAMLSSLPQLKMLGIGLQGHYRSYIPPKYSYLCSKLHSARGQNFIKKLCTKYKY